MTSFLGEYYQNLYKSKLIQQRDIDALLDNISLHGVLTNEQKEYLDKSPTCKEISSVLKIIKRNKAPGIDGLFVDM